MDQLHQTVFDQQLQVTSNGCNTRFLAYAKTTVRKEAQGSSTTVSRSDIRLIQHFDFSVGPECALNLRFPYPLINRRPTLAVRKLLACGELQPIEQEHAQLGIPETAHGPTLEYRQLPHGSSTHLITQERDIHGRGFDSTVVFWS